MRSHPRHAPPPAGRTAEILAPLAVLLAALVAYSNALHTPFIFDDLPRIVRNPLIRDPWPPWKAMAETTRPLAQYTLALNYAVSGLETWSYHALNSVFHALAGLALLGVLRRTIGRPGPTGQVRPDAGGLSLAATLIWVVHPLQTEGVTYVIQRAESLAGLFYLLTLYAVIRAAATARPWRWHAAAITACTLGMASKPVMATAPLAVFAYDRMFLAPSVAELWRRRRGLYLGLAATFALLPLVLMNGVLDWRTSSGMNVAGVRPLPYLLTQAGVILHYLRLSVWPAPLCLDYGWPIVARFEAAWLPVLIVAALLVLTVWACWRGYRLGYAGLWFFLILAPSSSFIPIADAAFEHRMYLPLAAPVVLATLGGAAVLRALARRAGPIAGWRAAAGGVTAFVIVALTATTVRRNEDYRSTLAIWSDTVRKRPANSRARVNLGIELMAQNRIGDGLAQLEEAVHLDPGSWSARLSLGAWLSLTGSPEAALPHLREAARLAPENGEVQFALGAVLLRLGDADQAYPHLIEARRLEPDRADTRLNLGDVLERRGRLDEAIREYEEAVRLRPADPAAHVSLGLALSRAGRAAEARRELEVALTLDPGEERIRRALEELDPHR